jgi:Ca2+-binding EF-hand superfamily protein
VLFKRPSPRGVVVRVVPSKSLTPKKNQDWQRVFRHFDKDGSGTIDTGELQSALNQFGMKLSPHLLSLLVAKFGMLGRQHPREIES